MYSVFGWALFLPVLMLEVWPVDFCRYSSNWLSSNQLIAAGTAAGTNLSWSLQVQLQVLTAADWGAVRNSLSSCRSQPPLRQAHPKSLQTLTLFKLHFLVISMCFYWFCSSGCCVWYQSLDTLHMFQCWFVLWKQVHSARLRKRFTALLWCPLQRFHCWLFTCSCHSQDLQSQQLNS